MELTPAKTDIWEVFVVVNEHWRNKYRMQINSLSKEPIVIGQDTVLHHHLCYPAAKSSLEEKDVNIT